MPAPGNSGRPAQRKPAPGKPAKNGPARKPNRKRSLSAGERRGAQLLLAILTVALVLYVIAVLIIAVFLWYSFGTTPKNTALYELQLLESDGKTKVKTYSVNQANNRYGLYIPYSVLAGPCSFGVAGDGEQVTLFLPGADGETGSIQCSRDSSLVRVNGTPVRLAAPILFEGDDYLLPVSLLENYVTGLTVQYDKEEKVCTVTLPKTPVFELKQHRPTPSAPCTDEQLALAERNAAQPPDASSGAPSDTSGQTSADGNA